jgi:hypothetical protein
MWIWINCTIKKPTKASQKRDKSNLPGSYFLSLGELKYECRVENQHPAKKNRRGKTELAHGGQRPVG